MSKVSNEQHKKKRKRTEDGPELQRRKSELAVGRTKLPVYQFKSEICRRLAKTDVLLVVAETGTKKLFKDCQSFERLSNSTIMHR